MDVIDVMRIFPGILEKVAMQILDEAKFCSSIRNMNMVTEKDVRLAARFYI